MSLMFSISVTRGVVFKPTNYSQPNSNTYLTSIFLHKKAFIGVNAYYNILVKSKASSVKSAVGNGYRPFNHRIFFPERYEIADHLAQNLARIHADTDTPEHPVLRQYLDQNFDPIDDTNLPESVSTILNADTSQKHVLPTGSIRSKFRSFRSIRHR